MYNGNLVWHVDKVNMITPSSFPPTSDKFPTKKLRVSSNMEKNLNKNVEHNRGSMFDSDNFHQLDEPVAISLRLIDF